MDLQHSGANEAALRVCEVALSQDALVKGGEWILHTYRHTHVRAHTHTHIHTHTHTHIHTYTHSHLGATFLLGLALK